MEERPISSLIREIFSNFAQLVQSEIRLAKAEVMHSVKVVGKQSAKTGIFTAVALLGGLAFLEFLILGLGVLLGDRYWLSAPIVSLLLLVPSAILIVQSIRKMKEGISISQSIESVQTDAEVLGTKLRDIRDARRVEPVSAPLTTGPSVPEEDFRRKAI